jgi:hypothetical protein
MIKFIHRANQGTNLGLEGVRTLGNLIWRCSLQFLWDKPHWSNYQQQLNSAASAVAPRMMNALLQRKV